MLTEAQLTTLGNHIRSNAEVNGNLGNLVAIANWYNSNSTFWVWKNAAPAADAVHAINLENFGSITEANSARVARAFGLYATNSNNFTPDAPTRAFFAGVFSVAAGAETRANFLTLWQRFATQVESLFATGTGTQCTALNSDGTPSAGSPGDLVFVGSVSESDIDRALELTAP